MTSNRQQWKHESGAILRMRIWQALVTLSTFNLRVNLQINESSQWRFFIVLLVVMMGMKEEKVMLDHEGYSSSAESESSTSSGDESQPHSNEG